jgi:hypothetical protein
MRALGLPVDDEKASVIDHMFVLLRQRGLTSNEQVHAFVGGGGGGAPPVWHPVSTGVRDAMSYAMH